MSDIWEVLGIEYTKDKDAILAAYRSKLVSTNPEDDPEGFKVLRAAYEEAVRLADAGESTGGISDILGPRLAYLQPLYDRTREIYMQLDTRQDESLWRDLMDSDEFRSIDTFEDAREVMLVFLMAHIYLPTTIMTMIVSVLRVREERQELQEKFPEDFIEFIIGCTEGTSIFDDGGVIYRDEYLDSFANPEDIPEYPDVDTSDYEPYTYDCEFDTYINAMNNINMLSDINPERAGCILSCVKDSEVWCPFEYSALMLYYNSSGEVDKAVRMARRVIMEKPELLYVAPIIGRAAYVLLINEVGDTFPIVKQSLGDMDWTESYMTRVSMALVKMYDGEDEKAIRILEDVLETNSGSKIADDCLNMVNRRFIDRQVEEYEASHNFETGISLGWAYLQTDRPDKAMEILEGMKDAIDDEFSYDSLYGRCCFGLNRYDEAKVYLSRTVTRIYSLQDSYAEVPEEEIPEKDRHRMDKLGIACYVMGEACMETGEYEDAITFIKKALTEETVDKLYLTDRLAQAYFESGDYQQAYDIWTDMLKHHNIISVLKERQEAAYKLFDGNAVMSDYSVLSKYEPEYLDSYCLAASILIDYGMPDEAMDVLNTAEEAGIQSDRLRMIYARLMHEQEKFRDAIDVLISIRENIASGDSDIEDANEVNTALASDWVKLSDEDGYESENCLSEARKYLDIVLSIDSDNMVALKVASEVAEKENKPADEFYNRLIELDADGYRYKYDYADYLARRGEYERAIKYYMSVLEADSTLSVIYNDIKEAYLDLYNRNEHREDLLSAVEYATKQLGNMDNPYFRIERALLYIRTCQLDEAIHDCEKALETEPRNYYAYSCMANVYRMKKQYNRAIELYKKALSCIDDNKGKLETPYMGLIKTYEAAHMFDEELKALDSFEDIFGSSERTLGLRSEVYIKMHEYREAYELRTKIAELLMSERGGNGLKSRSMVMYVQNQTVMLRLLVQMGDKSGARKLRKELKRYLKCGDERLSDAYNAVLYKTVGHCMLDLERDYKAARAFLEKALELAKYRDEIVDICEDLAEVYCRLGNKPAARLAAEKAIRLLDEQYGGLGEYAAGPEDRALRCSKAGILCYHAGRREESERYFDMVKSCVFCEFCKEDTCFDWYLLTARVLEDDGRTDEALARYREAERLGCADPELVGALLDLDDRR